VSNYLLGIAAEQDLGDIWEYIAQDNIESADRWVGKLFDAFEMIARNPGTSGRI
jgi:plasmid stabilization system protein ParE